MNFHTTFSLQWPRHQTAGPLGETIVLFYASIPPSPEKFLFCYWSGAWFHGLLQFSRIKPGMPKHSARFVKHIAEVPGQFKISCDGGRCKALMDAASSKIHVFFRRLWVPHGKRQGCKMNVNRLRGLEKHETPKFWIISLLCHVKFWVKPLMNDMWAEPS